MESIVQFIALDSPRYASLVAMAITARIEQLAAFPLSGRIVPEVNNPLVREVIIGNYRIVYRVN